MGVRPAGEKFDLPAEIKAAAACATYGGRVEAGIVKTSVPVVALDIASTYPLVNARLGTWRHWVAEHLDVADVTDELSRWLASPTMAEDLYEPATWRRWGVTLVELEPEGDVLIHQDHDRHGERLHTSALTYEGRAWWAWPDVAAATLAGDGKVARITRALRLMPRGRQRGLHVTRLRGGIRFDPRADDLNVAWVEERRRAEARGDDRLARFLKITANTFTYGIPLRFDRRRRGRPQTREVYTPTVGGHPTTLAVTEEEVPGPFHNGPVAACVTAGARLLLGMLEHAVTGAHGPAGAVRHRSADRLLHLPPARLARRRRRGRAADIPRVRAGQSAGPGPLPRLLEVAAHVECRQPGDDAVHGPLRGRRGHRGSGRVPRHPAPQGRDLRADRGTARRAAQRGVRAAAASRRQSALGLRTRRYRCRRDALSGPGIARRRLISQGVRVRATHVPAAVRRVLPTARRLVPSGQEWGNHRAASRGPGVKRTRAGHLSPEPDS